MIIEIAVVVAVIIFAILAAVIIQTLQTLRHTLLGIDRLNREISGKCHHLNSTLKTISNISEISELETEKMKTAYLHQKNKIYVENNHSQDVAEWILASLKLGSKLFLRRQSHESE